jgi:hypothetical protein
MLSERPQELLSGGQGTDESRRAFADAAELALAASARTRRAQRAAKRRRQRRLAVIVLAIVLAVAGTVTGLWLRGGKAHAPAAADTPSTSVPSAPRTVPSPATRKIPDFVWVASRRAAAYRIEFTDGGRLVLARTANAARLHVAASALAPGTYRWRVWALDGKGARIGAPIVDASVRIA